MTKFFNNLLSAALLGLGALPMLALSQAQAGSLF